MHRYLIRSGDHRHGEQRDRIVFRNIESDEKLHPDTGASHRDDGDLCIDESLVLWRGRLAFRQHMPNKRHRFGLKLFLICDVETGFMLDFILYTGAHTETQVDSKFSFAGSVVNILIEPNLSKGHNLFKDSYYTSPILIEHLQQNSTGACGTVRPNRKGMPWFPAVNRGGVSACHKNNMMCFKWSVKRMVHMLTSSHENRLFKLKKEITLQKSQQGSQKLWLTIPKKCVSLTKLICF
ncbi:piggyBac transposable element-derived protein 4-like [Penaeus monodon]|uniref:piggyBac transposable element-derived protein 4-like n=1 Tax=Penaeus monodon TaxID=6687 RepID=UPI0018A7A94B|nr:piggyBac transposable element-derived protein 4-like [Penaeus monodon]